MELLIVIVVIAVLAAITLVAFNGIANRAKASAAATAAEQAAKKVAIYAVSNGEALPNALSDAGVSDANGTSYQYRTYDNGKSFCITATANGVSAFVNNVDQTSPKAGACDGHGANGGTTITNLFPNPSIESLAQFWTNFGTGGAGSISLMSNGGAQGNSYFRQKWTTAPTAGTTGASASFEMPVAGGRSYTYSAYLRPSWTTAARLNFGFKDSGGVQTNINATVSALPAGVWTRLSVSATAPAGSVSVSVYPVVTILPPTNATLDGDGFMVTEGTVISNYADGDSQGWVWNGTPGNSTSTGPAL